MLTMIASDRPRLAVYMDVIRSRPWRGLVWTGEPRDHYGAHWWMWENRGVPLVRQRHPLWHMGYFNVFDREWLVVHARPGASPAYWEHALFLTRAFMDHFDIPPRDVMSGGEAWLRLGLASGGPSPDWDMERFRGEL
jgi:hypothetical protein